MVEERPTPISKIQGPAVQRLAPPTALTPKDILSILHRHMWLIIVLTIFGLIAGGGTWYFVRKYLPEYTARTYVEVMPPVETDPMVITSPYVQKEVLYGYRLSLASIIKDQRTLEDLLGRDKVKDTTWFKNRGENTRKAVAYLEKNFSANAQRDSDFIEISMTCRSKKEAALIVNEMLELFLNTQGSTKQREITDRLAKLDEERGRVQRDLDQYNKALDDIRTAWGITDLEMTPNIGRYYQHTITLRLNDLEIKKSDLALAIKQAQADIRNLEELATGPVTEQVEYAIERDPVMVLLAEQAALLESSLKGQLTKFGENHRVVRQTQDLINEIKEKRQLRKTEIAEQTRRAMLENARDTLIVMQERFRELETLRQEADAKQRDLDLARVQHSKAVAIRDERIKMLDSIKEQIEKWKILHDDPRTPKVRMVGYAPEPLEMTTSRQWYIWFPGGTIVGFLVSMVLSFLIELANDLVRAPRDVGRYLHIPLLGIVPDAAEDDQVRGIDLYRAVREAPYSIISESYRRCRTNLKLSGAVESLKSLLVTGGMAGDGTTSVAVNLAAAFVAEDKKVLLVDANFRHPSLHTLFPRAAGGEGRTVRFRFR